MALSVQIDAECEARLRSVVTAAQKKYRVMGIGSAVATNGVVVAQAVAGRTKRGGPAPTLTDRWHIGSVTKPMTSTLLGTLIDQGELVLDEPVLTWLPALQRAAHDSWNQVTLRHVLTHTHGGRANLPMRSQFFWPDSPEHLVIKRHEVLESILREPVNNTPGTTFRYSNFGYTLAGHVAEVTLEQPYEEIMQQRVFEPLDMSTAGFGAPPVGGPLGHRRLLGYDRPVKPGPNADNGPLMSAAGRAHMSLTDLLTFGNDFMNAMLDEPGSLLSHETATELTRVRVPDVNSVDYACGWVVNDRREAAGRVVWHNGSNTMWVALLSIFPEARTVMAFATNVGSIALSERAFAQVTSGFLAKASD